MFPRPRAHLILFILTLIFSSIASATSHKVIADGAELVSPLLNGQIIPDESVYDAQSNKLALRDLVEEKPAVIIFYRGGWCPYCSTQLADLKSIEKPLQEMGFNIIAISPDSPERLRKQVGTDDFIAQIYSDKDFRVSKAFGLGFYLKDKVAKLYRNKLGVNFVQLDGTSRVALPVPAAFIVDRSGLIHFQYVNPNYKVRVSPQLILEAARLLVK